MKTAANMQAISKLLLILLLLLAMIIGSIFSYMIVIGYYMNLEANVPEGTALTITSVTFDPRNATNFNITILNPTYSAGDADITEISVATENNKIYKITTVLPQLPSKLKKGEEETYNCLWSWGNFTGQTVKVIVIVEDGSGSTYAIKTAKVVMTITPVFSVLDTGRFNVTLNNIASSVSELNVTGITVTTENGTVVDVNTVNHPLPRLFLPGEEATFVCLWDWTDYRGTTMTINIITLQGITFYYTEKLPEKSRFSLTNIIFDTDDMSIFKMEVKISDPSINSANISAAGVIIGEESLPLVVRSPSSLPYYIPANKTVTFIVEWEWESFRGQTIVIGIETVEEYYGYSAFTVP